MSKTRLVYVAGMDNRDSKDSRYAPCCGYSNWMLRTGFVRHMEEADLVIGLGGSDVCSEYYNQPNGGYLGSSPDTDKQEYADFKRAIKLNKPIVGICKGMQWGAALAGGAIFQHMTHPSRHSITTFNGKKLIVNSLHHNLSDISNLKENQDYKLIGWAENLSPYHYDGYENDKPCEKEPEIVYYPKINLLGYQFHPEMMFRDEDFAESISYCRTLLNNFLDKKL